MDLQCSKASYLILTSMTVCYLTCSDASTVEAFERKYEVIKQGRCRPGTQITTRGECAWAGVKVTLSSDVYGRAERASAGATNPSHCYYQEGKVFFRFDGNTGGCSTTSPCICLASPGMHACMSHVFILTTLSVLKFIIFTACSEDIWLSEYVWTRKSLC